MKPVYMINGFLDSGKTDFIAYTLVQPYFKIEGKTLLILCEEGDVEYEEELLKNTNTVVELLLEESSFTPSKLIELEKKHQPERIVIEFNGMWNYKTKKLPWHWAIEQQVTLIDATTFKMYYTNMKSLLAEMLRKSELILFNRCDGIDELNSFKRNVKAVNQNAEIIFEDADGEVDEIMEDDLPYDLKNEVLKLEGAAFGIWYLDCLDHLERYIGKKVEFTAMVLRPAHFPADYFVPGRLAMTCCADDMAFLGFACAYEGAEKLKDKQWVKVFAEVKKEYFADYQGEGPILHGITVAPAKAPKDEIISFM